MAKIIKATITSSSIPRWRLIFRVIATNIRRFKYEVTGCLQSPQRLRHAPRWKRGGFAPDTATPAASAPRVVKRDGLPSSRAQPQRDALRQNVFTRPSSATTLRQPPLAANATP